MNRRFLKTLSLGFKEGIGIAGKLLTIVIPLYFLISFLALTPLFSWLARIASPLMGIMKMPGEAAIPLVIGSLSNLYAGIAAMAPLNLSPKQVTLMGIILGISHNLVVETSVLSRAGTRGLTLAFYRIFTGLCVGAVMAWVMPG